MASRRAHNPETAGSNPAPAMKKREERPIGSLFPFVGRGRGQDENLVGLPELPQDIFFAHTHYCVMVEPSGLGP